MCINVVVEFISRTTQNKLRREATPHTIFIPVFVDLYRYSFVFSFTRHLEYNSRTRSVQRHFLHG